MEIISSQESSNAAQERIERDKDGRIAFRRTYVGNTLKSVLSYLYDKNGHALHAFESDADEAGTLRLRRTLDLYPDGTTLCIREKDRHACLRRDGSCIIRVEHEEAIDAREALLLNAAGKKGFGTYTMERRKHPTLTAEDYVALLAEKLKSREQLHFYFRYFVKYVSDRHDRFRGADYWQSPEETVERNTGDCEDFCFLAQRILALQGTHAVVVNLGTHAACVWMERREDGRFDICSLCNKGLNINGNIWTEKQNERFTSGFAPEELAEAFRALLAKYEIKAKDMPDPEKIRVMQRHPDFKGEGKITPNTTIQALFKEADRKPRKAQEEILLSHRFNICYEPFLFTLFEFYELLTRLHLYEIISFPFFAP